MGQRPMAGDMSGATHPSRLIPGTRKRAEGNVCSLPRAVHRFGPH
jgi:hypothetical protein